MFIELPSVAGVPEGVRRAWEVIPLSTLGHVTDFVFPRGLRHMNSVTRLLGSAVTVKIPRLDSTAVQCALDLLTPGDVLVIDQSGDRARSCVGGTVAFAAQTAGAAGILTSGMVNDIAEIAALDIPVFAAGITPHTTRLLGIEGAINVPVCVGGVAVTPGDLVISDEDGVAVIPPALAPALLQRSQEIEERLRTRRTRERLLVGESLATMSGARRLFDATRLGASDDSTVAGVAR